MRKPAQAYKSFFHSGCQSGQSAFSQSLYLFGIRRKKGKRIQNNNDTHCPRLKPPDSPGDRESRQKTRACLFASGGPLSEEAPRIHLHANRPGQSPSGQSRQKLGVFHTQLHMQACHTHTQSSLHLLRPLLRPLLHRSVFGVVPEGCRRRRPGTRGGTREEGRVEELLSSLSEKHR